MTCGYTTATSSGTFTVYNKELTKCEAKRFCRDKGHILAPITTQEDKNAVLKLLDPSCDIHKGGEIYLVGLDITPCGKSQDRTFTNGQSYKESVHGHLYEDYNDPDTKCPIAYFDSIIESLEISKEPQCISQRQRFLCLDQSTAVASPIVKDDDHYIKLSATQAAITAGGIFIAFGCLALATAKFYSQKKKLEQEALKNEANY